MTRQCLYTKTDKKLFWLVFKRIWRFEPLVKNSIFPIRPFSGGIVFLKTAIALGLEKTMLILSFGKKPFNSFKTGKATSLWPKN